MTRVGIESTTCTEADSLSIAPNHQVVATDLNDTALVGVATVYINLVNWNDEQPIFERSVQTVSFNETEGKGFYVATMLATDRDIGDRVV